MIVSLQDVLGDDTRHVDTARPLQRAHDCRNTEVTREHQLLLKALLRVLARDLT